MSIDTQDMKVVHRVFRRETRQLIDLVAAVTPGDTARAKVIADHYAFYRIGLHSHHEGEDDVLWPLLLARVDLGTDIVLRMQEQHERVVATMTRLDAAFPAWTAEAGADERDALVAALTDHRAVVIEHIDDEEEHLLPLAAEYITEKEWASLGDHLVNNTPKLTLLTLFGFVLEDANPAERRALLSALPAPVRGIWRIVGRPRYARHLRRVRATA